MDAEQLSEALERSAREIDKSLAESESLKSCLGGRSLSGLGRPWARSAYKIAKREWDKALRSAKVDRPHYSELHMQWQVFAGHGCETLAAFLEDENQREFEDEAFVHCCDEFEELRVGGSVHQKELSRWAREFLGHAIILGIRHVIPLLSAKFKRQTQRVQEPLLSTEESSYEGTEDDNSNEEYQGGVRQSDWIQGCLEIVENSGREIGPKAELESLFAMAFALSRKKVEGYWGGQDRQDVLKMTLDNLETRLSGCLERYAGEMAAFKTYFLSHLPYAFLDVCGHSRQEQHKRLIQQFCARHPQLGASPTAQQIYDAQLAEYRGIYGKLPVSDAELAQEHDLQQNGAVLRVKYLGFVALRTTRANWNLGESSIDSAPGHLEEDERLGRHETLEDTRAPNGFDHANRIDKIRLIEMILKLVDELMGRDAQSKRNGQMFLANFGCQVADFVGQLKGIGQPLRPEVSGLDSAKFHRGEAAIAREHGVEQPCVSKAIKKFTIALKQLFHQRYPDVTDAQLQLLMPKAFEPTGKRRAPLEELKRAGEILLALVTNGSKDYGQMEIEMFERAHLPRVTRRLLTQPLGRGAKALCPDANIAPEPARRWALAEPATLSEIVPKHSPTDVGLLIRRFRAPRGIMNAARKLLKDAKIAEHVYKALTWTKWLEIDFPDEL